MADKNTAADKAKAWADAARARLPDPARAEVRAAYATIAAAMLLDHIDEWEEYMRDELGDADPGVREDAERALREPFDAMESLKDKLSDSDNYRFEAEDVLDAVLEAAETITRAGAAGI